MQKVHRRERKVKAMAENKQIDGMARLMCKFYADDPNCCRCPDCWVRDEAKVLYEAGYQKQEWISVEERLPENDYEKHWKERQRFLVYTEPNGLMYVAKYGYKEYGWWSDGGGYVLDEKNYRKVTHWMPLPQPPKGE